MAFAESEASSLSIPGVLIVEDFKMMAKQIQKLISSNSYRSEVVADGVDAVRKMQKDPDGYFCILLDS